ncbi:protein kinase [Penicillium hispanicum]|uniref:protein kinase n=1 Tax=Penicillium hispanicum TaxID=1080232 RepID=UPI0025407A73|nr:protein kinase [Penicillium hispanicum]KAJ5580194.1 protein kinase [Penicillium hispanicum]
MHNVNVNGEVKVLKHMSAIQTKHIGSTLLHGFEIDGPKDKHQYIVFEPLITSISHFQSTLDPPRPIESIIASDFPCFGLSSFRSYEGRTVYKSRAFSREQGLNKYGLPLLSDFGEARIGEAHTGLIKPDIYRAPEVVLGMTWTSKVDI